jgi:hypothetical protein
VLIDLSILAGSVGVSGALHVTQDYAAPDTRFMGSERHVN